MAKNKQKKIINNKEPRKAISDFSKSELSSELYKNNYIAFDLSFKGCFYSVNKKFFNNCLKDADDFVIRYRECMNALNKLSGHTIEELMLNAGFRHCHPLETKDEKKAHKIIKELCRKAEVDDSYIQQNIGAETIFQIGYEGSARFFGLCDGNIFRLLFIDYFHDYFPDERRNERNLKKHNYCPMTN